MQNEPKQISDGTWWLWFGIGLFVWVLGLTLLLIPVAGEILSEFLDWISFGALALWCNMNNVAYPGKNRTMWIGVIVGMVPVLDDIIPDLLISIWFIKRGHKKQQKALTEAKSQEKNNLVEMQKVQNQKTSDLKKAA
jgi:hypothetical protein